MKGEAKYPEHTVDEAVQLLDVYASQAAWRVPSMHHLTLDMVSDALDADGAYRLAQLVWSTVGSRGDLYEEAAEAAQRLREGWLP